MDFRQIQELIKMINKSNIGELTIEQKDFKISIRQKEENVTQIVQSSPMQAPALAVPQAQPATPAPAGGATPAEKPKTTEPASNTITVKSPMIGTFYRKPSPDKPNFVDEGDIIAPGKIICVIEAMKLFNEIEAEVSGKIIKVLVDDASPVEFDQPLFIVEP
ncbi:MAG: acetyl-CoA carboxylase, biotin carboxyl carrier protein [Sphingobacteriales bacterium 41-5]|nr:MAG: acetyl-CoA carboxylase, biotin carboxyl carrier protein [Niabella sp. SCN 42-15]OJU23729.1 MAG: acetyl-CoA carboxylase, biotin carboxyl carrier protein [Sphingobacteriales bacterium 41-5]